MFTVNIFGLFLQTAKMFYSVGFYPSTEISRGAVVKTWLVQSDAKKQHNTAFKFSQ